MKLAIVKTVFNEKLKTKYPDIKIHGKDVQQGYDTPCFFTSLVSTPETHSNKNYASGGVTYKIVYFQDIKDELDQLTKIDEIYEVFDKTITIGNRTLEIKEKDFDYVGEKSDILEISIKIEWLENRYKEPEEPAADRYKINIRRKVDECARNKH